MKIPEFEKVVVDADMYAFRVCKAIEKEVNFGDVHTLSSSFSECLGAFKSSLAKDMKVFKGNPEAIMCFTDKVNWRKVENPEYKAHRKDRKPLCFARLMEWCKENMNSIVYPGLEADDVMGLMSTYHVTGEVCILSGDKDMQTIPGWLYDPGRFKGPQPIIRAMADYNFYFQALKGDTADGYKGLPGCGDKGANALLEPHFSEDKRLFNEVAAWEDIVEAFRKKELDSEDAIQNARMARIVRYGDWDVQNECMVWKPVTE